MASGTRVKEVNLLASNHSRFQIMKMLEHTHKVVEIHLFSLTYQRTYIHLLKMCFLRIKYLTSLRECKYLVANP